MLERLEKLGPREKFGLTIAALVIGALLLDHFVVRYVITHYENMGSDIRHTKNQLRFQAGVLRKESRVRAEYDAVRGRLGKAESESEAIDRMKGEIDRQAQDAGVVVVSMQHRSPRDELGCREYVLEVGKFEADLDGLLRFLNACQGAQGMLRVPKLTVTPEKEVGRISGSMQITKLVVNPSAD